MTKKYCIIGASAAGVAAAKKIRQLDDAGDITCFTAEPQVPYNKCFLVDYVAGIKPYGDLGIFTESDIRAKRVNLLTDCPIISIDPQAQCIVDVHGVSHAYDALLIATGSKAFVPFPDHCRTDIFTFHTLNDINSLVARIFRSQSKRIVIIGAGLTGIEACDALLRMQCDVTIVESKPHILSTLIASQAADFLSERLKGAGVKVVTSGFVMSIEKENNVVQGVSLSNGDFLPADIVICAVGQRPNTDLANNVGSQMCNGYLIVDQYQATTIQSIFAAGDCVMVQDARTGQLMPSVSWPDAMQQGICAAYAMVGKPQPYRGLTSLISSSFFGVNVTVGGYLKERSHYNIADSITFSAYERTATNDNNELDHFVFIGSDMNRLRQLRVAFMSKI